MVDPTQFSEDDPQRVVFELANLMIDQLEPSYLEDLFLSHSPTQPSCGIHRVEAALLPHLEAMLPPEDVEQVMGKLAELGPFTADISNTCSCSSGTVC